jgi:hypothetical protein
VTGSLEKDWPVLVEPELECYPIQGLRMHESVFFHIPSRSLICADLVFNMGNVFTGIEKKFMQWNQVVDRFGPSRIFRWVFVSNRKAFSESIRTIARIEFDKVVMSHGDIVRQNGQSKFVEAFENYIKI